MKFRRHAGGLAESMATVVEVADRAELWTIAKAIYQEWTPGFYTVTESDLSIEHYGYDSRNGWDTHIVRLNGSTIGFTDGPLSEVEP